MRLVTVSGSESPGKHLMNYVEHCLQYHIETGYIGNIIRTYLYHPGKIYGDMVRSVQPEWIETSAISPA